MTTLRLSGVRSPFKFRDVKRFKEFQAEGSRGLCQCDGLSKLYFKKLLPLETLYKFHDFHSPPLEKSDFESKPMVLLIGQYSTGKTTFIRYLIGEDFPGIRIGPEPTTDSFIAVMNDARSGIIPGNALVMDYSKQFRPLSKFGNGFLNRFQCAHMPNGVLDGITFIDTPGILSGEKQRVDRGYDFSGVIEWFAERADRIILLFDAHKLDISDEFRRVIEVLKVQFSDILAKLAFFVVALILMYYSFRKLPRILQNQSGQLNT
uniref:Dynamin-type G domain-containing protein n=1 Tax=Schistosoma curassoni TaxID=6186 RepID=A0A183KIN5_9TREM